MRTLVFSDTHLTGHFDQAQCHYIAKLVKSVDQVVLNGDFWDGYLSTYADFAKAWQPLLDALAQPNTLYLPGNHDRLEWLNKKKVQFATVVEDELELSIGSNRYRILHGDHIAPEFDDRHPSVTRSFAQMYWMVVWLRKHWLLGVVMRWYHFQVSKRFERMLIEFASAKASQNEQFIFGHTHLTANLPEKHYLNPGISTPQVMRYILIDEHGYEFFETPISEDKVY